jgi:mycofactocin precursor
MTDRSLPSGSQAPSQPYADPADDVGDVGDGAPVDEDLVLDDLLVDEVSIDGMCGVY